jgi:DNA-binding winged helix-turn-helix (wHTH) protein
LYDLVWPGRVVEENNLAVQVLALRRLLGTQAVATVPGRGYRFTLSLDGDEPPAAQQDRRRRPAPPPGAGPAPFVPPGPSPRMLGKV